MEREILEICTTSVSTHKFIPSQRIAHICARSSLTGGDPKQRYMCVCTRVCTYMRVCICTYASACECVCVREYLWPNTGEQCYVKMGTSPINKLSIDEIMYETKNK